MKKNTLLSFKWGNSQTEVKDLIGFGSIDLYPKNFAHRVLEHFRMEVFSDREDDDKKGFGVVLIFFNLFFEEDSAEERSEDLDDLKFKNFQEARIII